MSLQIVIGPAFVLVITGAGAALRQGSDCFSISYDGKTLFRAEDNTFAGPGKVAVWTKADSVTHFDMIAITPLD
jgi:hypothetical protein